MSIEDPHHINVDYNPWQQIDRFNSEEPFPKRQKSDPSSIVSLASDLGDNVYAVQKVCSSIAQEPVVLAASGPDFADRYGACIKMC
ncbi:hypothetical protein [Pedobacter sp. Leaf176]|uniref:hypothetical protein n=1 Tax=Pedobacter sp. Leaf176 TaxID=1736286 RepID=UPI0006FE5EA1|nr:hypothetical protein [Pedobacter sp. Leaf176]KQR67721.1 hypothetical protein ASF92_18800 [Pedobacter sp. Leaf176]